MQAGLYALLFFMACGQAVAHQQKIAITTVLFNPRTENIEIMHRFNLHDAEHAVKSLFKKTADILDDQETQTAFARYVANRFVLLNAQDDSLPLNLVGFEVDVNFPPNPGGAHNGTNAQTPGNQSSVVNVLVRDLQIGGGANLFVHEDYGNASIYSTKNDSFSGLRDYPLVKSPNVAQVSVALFQNSDGSAPATGNSYADMGTQVIFSCNLVCEILQDDQYGSHIPGPYARKGAMVRRG